MLDGGLLSHWMSGIPKSTMVVSLLHHGLHNDLNDFGNLHINQKRNIDAKYRSSLP